jgi:hypothetical protein
LQQYHPDVQKMCFNTKSQQSVVEFVRTAHPLRLGLVLTAGVVLQQGIAGSACLTGVRLVGSALQQ